MKKTPDKKRIRDESATNPQRIRDESATNPQRIRDESATNPLRIRYAFVPLLQQFRDHTRKNDARLWIPIETSLLTRYEFAALSPQTRYVFVAILLYCGANGMDEIPLDAKFISNVIVADFRTVDKSLDELLSVNLLQEREKREKKEKRKEQTDRQKETAARVSVSDENFSQNENQNQNEEKEVGQIKVSEAKQSEFSLQECKKYVEAEIKDGANITNANALAMKLFNTGQSDAFIKARLYPEQVSIEQFGQPRSFTEYPCKVCFGAKQAEIDGKGYGKCQHCRNERGVPTGLEPVSDTS